MRSPSEIVFGELGYDPGGMLLVGRSWVAGSENYRFGFNGKENTDEVYGEGNAVDFGARIYDSRLGRWFSVDPLFSKFPWISPYTYCFDNPISYLDIEGKEPTRILCGTIEDANKYFKDNNLTTMKQIRKHLKDQTVDIYKSGDNKKGMVRYVYTEDNGWIDLYHYFRAAQDGQRFMSIAEKIQDLRDKASAKSYEDLPSNKMGAEAPLFKWGETTTKDDGGISTQEPIIVEKTGDELFEAVLEDFNEAGATTPQSAPNYRQIPAVKTRDPLPDGINATETQQLLRTGKYVPKNNTSKPYDLTNFDPARDSYEGEEIKLWKHVEDPF